LGNFCTFDYKKPFTLVVCGECTTRAFDLAFVSFNTIPFIKFFSHDFFLSLEEKTKQTYVFPFLEKYHFVTISFDLWMSKDVHDVFAMVIFFIGI
jgi:hypothetical protein